MTRISSQNQPRSSLRRKQTSRSLLNWPKLSSPRAGLHPAPTQGTKAEAEAAAEAVAEAAVAAEIGTLATGRPRERLKEPTTTIQIVRGSLSGTPLGRSARGVSATVSGQRSTHTAGVRVEPAIMPNVRKIVQTKAEPSSKHTSTGKSRMFSPPTQMQHMERSTIFSRDISSPPQIQTSKRTL